MVRLRRASWAGAANAAAGGNTRAGRQSGTGCGRIEVKSVGSRWAGVEKRKRSTRLAGRLPETAARCSAGGRRGGPDGAGDPGSAAAAIAAGILGEILLVIVLGIEEFRRRQDLGADRALVAGLGQGLLVSRLGQLGRFGLGV